MSLHSLQQNARRSICRLRRLSSIAKIETQAELLPEMRMQDIVRHSEADGVITLNVGGKEFKTLRSTIQINSILRDHVVKAEANKELVSEAVFIDRSPDNFGLILAHLRNVADSISTTTSKKKVAVQRMLRADPGQEVNIQIPTDKAKVRDLFIEARYFQIHELEAAICNSDFFTWLASLMGGSGSANPFNVAAQSLQVVQRSLLATGGVGFFIGSQNESFMDQVKGIGRNLYLIVTGQSRPGDQGE